MEIKHRSASYKGSFYMEDGGVLLAEITYSLAGPDKLIINYTSVSDVLRGHGTGNDLVDAVVSYARDNKLMIFPLCPFAKSVFEKTPAYIDVYLH